MKHVFEYLRQVHQRDATTSRRWCKAGEGVRVDRGGVVKATWNGAISFGLVTIPIAVYPTVESHAVSFHQIHTADGGRIRYRKTCELDGQELSGEEIGRGYETATGTLVEVTDADLDGLPLPTAKAIEIVSFVPADSIDPIQIGASYYLGATGVAAKPYELLRRALLRSRKVAVAKFALRDRERLGLLRVIDNVIVLHGLRWPDEIRSASQVAVPDVEVSKREVDAAVALAETLTGTDMSEMRDEYRAALEKVIEAKAAGARPALPEPAAPGASAQVVDLMAMLEKSVNDAKAARGDGAEATVHDLPAKKTAAKKASSAKTAKKATKRSPGRSA
ncbi:Ku protein [Streptomyces sp. SPB4]|uniref:non-homologous end joining protein Ku n=1 Tax=Streptomyces sp. SPB4 TaxID=2940553 RepID=UPI002473068E|nr:Ku protein [Streptomyces sp. SPB4]MDH6544942.1 DNA end-binding protein Ku [Streptomyces sp. SPB4]